MRPAACAHELLEDKAPLDKPSRGGGCALRAAGGVLGRAQRLEHLLELSEFFLPVCRVATKRHRG